jgi:hypothetical protein
MIMWAAGTSGPKAVPGSYQARLTVTSAGTAGAPPVVQTAPFQVRKHPLLTSLTDADFRAQFDLAMQVRDRVSAADEAVLRIRSLKDQARSRAAAVKKGPVVAASEALAEKLTAIEGEIYQYRNQSSQDPLNYPIKLNNKLAALLGVIDSADGRPTAQSYEAFTDLSARLEAQLAKLAEAEKTDVAAFNTLLLRAKLAPVK